MFSPGALPEMMLPVSNYKRSHQAQSHVLVSSRLITKCSVPYERNRAFQATTAFPVCSRLGLLASSLHCFLLDWLLSLLHTRAPSLRDSGKHVTTYLEPSSEILTGSPVSGKASPSRTPPLPGPRLHPTVIHATSCLFQYLPSHELKTSVQIHKKMFKSCYLNGGDGERGRQPFPLSSVLSEICCHVHAMHSVFTHCFL